MIKDKCDISAKVKNQNNYTHLKNGSVSGVLIHTCYPNTCEAEQEDWKIEVNMEYIMSSRTAWTT